MKLIILVICSVLLVACTSDIESQSEREYYLIQPYIEEIEQQADKIDYLETCLDVSRNNIEEAMSSLESFSDGNGYSYVEDAYSLLEDTCARGY